MFANMQPAAREDLSLVRETLDGNQLSFQLLIERYQERVFGLVRHYAKSAVEIEDIVQDTFIKAFRKLDTFQHQSSFSTWLYRIAVNTSLDFLKRAGRNPVQAVEDPELSAATGRAELAMVGAPDAGLEREEVARITQRVLEELPEIFPYRPGAAGVRGHELPGHRGPARDLHRDGGVAPVSCPRALPRRPDPAPSGIRGRMRARQSDERT